MKSQRTDKTHIGLPAVLCCLVVLCVSVPAEAANATVPTARTECRRTAAAPSVGPGADESAGAPAVVIPAGGNVAGDEVPAAARVALDHYAARRLPEALTAFADAAAAVRRELAAELAACLPPAPRGWRVEDTDVCADARGATGITVRRRYRQAAGAVVVSIAALSPFVQGTRSLIENPSLLPPGGETTIVSWRGFPALAGSAPGGGREVQIVIADDCLLSVTGPPADREGGLDYHEILGALDFLRLRRLVGANAAAE
ncbi:MAG: hypothetical protein JW781_08345 [Deltaproteobacteria bacterium]|nr:hypothetical protein [Candidatus Anaeroferrophillacea bacterium]